MKNIRILLCDDHNVVRSGIASLLKNEEGIFVVGEAENGLEMVSKYFITNPDLIIADIEMPELTGTEAHKKIKETVPDVKVLFLSIYYSEQYIYYALKAGAMGLLNKSINKGELLYAVSEIMDGRKYFGSKYNQQNLNELVKKYDHKKKPFEDHKISEFDAKMLSFISDGMTSLKISEKLCCSKHTIDAHRSNIMQEFNLLTGHDLFKFAVMYTEGKKI